MQKWCCALMVVALVHLVAGPASAEVFAYPKKGQTQQQFEQDQFSCHKWAKDQTGVDPSKPQGTAAAPPPQYTSSSIGGCRSRAARTARSTSVRSAA